MTIIHAAPVALAAAILISTPGVSAAQAIAPVERNLPPVISGGGRLVVGPQDLGASADDTALGVTLKGVTLIGPHETLVRRPAPGLSIGAIGEVSRPALAAMLQPFIGQTLSRKRLAEIQIAISRVYREAGFPLVSVTLPPQEVTGGILTLRVVEFRMGEITTKGVSAEAGADLIARLRAAPGERIATEALDEDIAWLNRFPFQTVTGVFTPGKDIGLSTLTLDVTPQKPWQVFAGYSNTGTHTTGLDRLFTGFGASLPGVPQSSISYQLTGSPDLFTDASSVGTGPTQPLYHSQSGRLVLATGARQAVEIAPTYIATRQNARGFPLAYTSTTFELPVAYRFAVSNLVPGFHAGDIQIGMAWKALSRSSYFTGVDIGGARVNLFELALGWSISRPDAFGVTSLDAKLVVNPGGVLGRNTDADWSNYTAGRVTRANFVYGRVDVNRVTRLPLGLAWVSQISALAAGQNLPDTEQFGLGGLYAVRGYALDDGTADTGVIWRNELRAPSFEPFKIGCAEALSHQLSPYAFFDMAWGRTFAWKGPSAPIARRDARLAGVGLGLDYNVARNFSATIAGGFALTDAVYSRSGDFNLKLRVTASY